MKIIKELKTKNVEAKLIILAKSCTCSTCFNKIKAGTKFLRIKSSFLTLNYCSAKCMQHPLITGFKEANVSEDQFIPTEDTHAWTERYMAGMKNLNLPLEDK